MTRDRLIEVTPTKICDEERHNPSSRKEGERGGEGMLPSDASNNEVIMAMVNELRVEHGLSNRAIARVLRIGEDAVKIMLQENERRHEG